MIAYKRLKPKNFIETPRNTVVPIKKSKIHLSFHSTYLLIFLLPLTLLFFHKVKASTKEPAKVLSASVEKKIDTPEDLYKKTLITSFDPEPTWHASEAVNTSNQPEISGKTGFMMEPSTGKVVFDLDSRKRMKIASLAKIMTAVVALEHADTKKVITVSEKAATIGENSMGISQGETYTLNELLYGLVLPSGNDAAYAIAEGVAGDSDTFVKWMNIKAKELDLSDTYYADPSGLDDSSYSTAYDLAKLTRYAMKYQTFRDVVKTLDKEITGDGHKYIYLSNQTNLLRTYPGVQGVKTGYTEDAGLCLVTYASNSNVELIGVVLDSIDRKGDMILMLDHGFSTLGVHVVHHLLDK